MTGESRRPLYSACNEDSRTELRALAPGAADSVVCIAAGGGRALALLGAGPRRLVAVDRRPSQLHVLELEAAALEALPLARLHGFLGVEPAPTRLDVYSGLRAALSPAARRYWDARRDLVAAGALYAGRLEHVLHRQADWLERTHLMRWPRACFAATSLAAQRRALERAACEVARGERIWRALLHPISVALVLRDPSFRRSTEGPVGRYLYRRLLAFAARRLLAESPLLHLIYFGRYDPHRALPVWLTPNGAERARKHLARLSFRCLPIETLPGRLRCDDRVHWSLSDVSAWMDAAHFHALLGRIAAASPAGSRLCWRHLAARWPTPALARLRIDAPESALLEHLDSSVFYTVTCATVVEPGARSGPRDALGPPREDRRDRL